MTCSRHSVFFMVFLMLLTPCLLWAQTRKVSGRVLSGGDGSPLEGVTIQVKGSIHGSTLTNASGVFSLSINFQDTLLVSYAGYESAVIRPGGRDSVEIVLAPSGGRLQNVVVIGYGTVKKKDLTGSVASVDTKDIASLPVANVGDAMEGKAAGVQVISSGAPGSNVTFRIRGTGTINDASPLVVIDGVPTDAPLNNLDPNDIASLDILKDASAAAIYGSRGANGVILVTTKKGGNGKGHLSFNYYTAWQHAAKVVKMLNAAQFAALNNEMLTAGNQTVNPAYAHPDSLGVGTDWLGALFRTAPMQHFSLSYSGGSDKYNYYVGGGLLDQEGIVINTRYRRYTVQFNSQARPLGWISFGNNLTMTADDKPSGSYDIRSTMAANPVQPLYNKDGTWSNVLGNPLWYGDITNQIGTAHVNQNDTKGYNLLGSVYTEISLFRGLKFKTTAGVQAQFFDSRSWAPVYNFQPNPQTAAYLSRQFNKNLTYLWDNYFTYDRSFGTDHHLTVLAGSSAQNNRYDFLSGNKTGFPSDATQELRSGTSLPNTDGTATEWSLLSFMGRINYSYQDKYLITATIRRDGSSRFGANNKYGTFPSASVAWRISKEDFFSGVPFINDLKVRAGYGVTGNQNIGNYSFSSALQTAQYNFNGNIVSIVYPLVLPNPDVQWEQVSQGNIGVDASLLDSRINVTVDAYVKHTSRMLVPAIVPVTTGYSSTVVPSVNAASMENKGVEITLSTRNIRGAFTWNTDMNVSFNQNIIKSLNDSTPLYVDDYGLNAKFGIHQTGHPAGEFYGYVMNGIFQEQKDVDAHALQQPGTAPYNSTSPGDIRFADLNSDGVIDDKDRTYIGDPSPRIIYSMGNSFSYKGFDLNIYFQGVYGNKIFNANNINQESMSIAENQTVRVLDRWHGAGTSQYMPRAVYGDPNQNTRVSNRYVESGSYLRLKNITLGYTFPSRLTKRIGIPSLRVYGACQNVFTLTHYSGFDPEVGVNGVDYSVYPVTRTISAGININL